MPLAASSSEPFILQAIAASGSTDELELVPIDIGGNAVIDFNSNEMFQDEPLAGGSNLRGFIALPEDTSLEFMFESQPTDEDIDRIKFGSLPLAADFDI